MKTQRGQAIIIVVLVLGVILAAIIFFGGSRVKDTADVSSHMLAQQQALEALAAAAKRVQVIYANEAACDPVSLNARLSNLPNLPATASSLGLNYGGQSVDYVIAYPGQSGSTRYNICSTSGTGCRQMAIPVDRKVFVVTVGAVSSDSVAVTGDCPRDVSVNLSTTVSAGTTGASSGDRRAVYTQRVTLTNLCTLKACGGGWGFDTPGTITLSGAKSTTACSAPYAHVRATKYGGGITSSATNQMAIDDIRWARRFLETGGEGVGDASFFYGLIVTGNENGACLVSPSDYSGGQCVSKPCFPNFDLNRDGKNNDEDLGILENFMRGYITTLPVNELN